jgi:hypothetical protein
MNERRSTARRALLRRAVNHQSRQAKGCVCHGRVRPSLLTDAPAIDVRRTQNDQVVNTWEIQLFRIVRRGHRAGRLLPNEGRIIAWRYACKPGFVAILFVWAANKDISLQNDRDRPVF